MGLEYKEKKMPAEMTAAFKRAGLSPPKTLTLAVTDACNLLCTHCWVEAKPRTAPAVMSALTVRRLIEEFAQMGGEGVRFTGGEPLLHPDWSKFMEFAIHLGFAQVELQTNGLLLGEKAAAFLAKISSSSLKIQISLDGANSETHDWLRGPEAYSGTVTGIRRLVDAGLGRQVSIFFTEAAHNLAEFPELLALAEKLGVASVVSGTLISGGRAANGRKVAPPEPEQYLELLERYQNDARFRELYGVLGTMTAIEWWIKDTPGRSCCSLVENPYLTPSGLLYPCLLCHNDSYAARGVFEASLFDAFSKGIERWSSLQRTAERRKRNIPLCRTCPERTGCAAGCIGRAWGSCGDLLAPDDRCEVRRLVGLNRRSIQKKA